MIAIQAATKPTPTPSRLLWYDAPHARSGVGGPEALLEVLDPGDVLVLNDAATIPSALFGKSVSGAPLELRLIAKDGPSEWTAALFGAGDWRTPTERRPPPPALGLGDRLTLDGAAIEAEIIGHRDDPRLVRLRFLATDARLASALYRFGRPVQYSYLERALSLPEVQTAYATRPWSVEMPSAGRPLSWRLLLELRRRGVVIATLTHAAGLSSIGDEVLDRLLPLPERYEIPTTTVEAIRSAQASGGRVVAVGTTVARALESAAGVDGAVVAGPGLATLVLGPEHRLRVVDGILSGTHEPGSSHHRLLQAFIDASTLDGLLAEAARRGHRGHEFGDAMLILGRALRH